MLIHGHYYLIFSTAIAMLNTYTIGELWQRTRSLSAGKIWIACVGLLAVLALSLTHGIMQIEALTPEPFMRRMAKIIQDYTPEGDKLLAANRGWGSDLHIHAGREGLSVDSTVIGETSDSLAELKKLGFTHFVALSELPLPHAQQITNPGSTDREIELVCILTAVSYSS